MEIRILLTKEDISTRKLGLHYEIITRKGVVINFSPDALDEFLNDINALKEIESAEKESKEIMSNEIIPPWVLHARNLGMALFKVYDKDHNEISLIISIDFKTGEITRAVKDENGKTVVDGDSIKKVKEIYQKFSIEYNELNEPGN
jgi:hypothetical protein